MTDSRHVTAIARITAELTDDYDATAVLQHIVVACSTALGGHPTGILMLGDEGVLEFVAGSSHIARDLELYHAQVDEGPARDCISANADVEIVGNDALLARWPAIGTAMTERGVGGVVASPLRWRDQALGALNVFLIEPTELDAAARATMHAMSDLAVVCLLYSRTQPEDTDVAEGLQTALEDRALLELAKGVVSAQDRVDPGTAFQSLSNLADERRQPLPGLSQRAIEMAASGRPWKE